MWVINMSHWATFWLVSANFTVNLTSIISLKNASGDSSQLYQAEQHSHILYFCVGKTQSRDHFFTWQTSTWCIIGNIIYYRIFSLWIFRGICPNFEMVYTAGIFHCNLQHIYQINGLMRFLVGHIIPQLHFLTIKLPEMATTLKIFSF